MIFSRLFTNDVKINMVKEKPLYDLDHQLERSVGWVKFAEAKNGVAIGFIGTAFVSCCSKPVWENSLSGKLLIVVLTIQLLLLISSFIPRFSSPLLRKKCVKDFNFHYYGNIAQVSLFEFRERIVAAYQDLEKNSKYFLDVTHQIHVNCEIAMVKFILFKYTCYLTLLSGIFFFMNRWGII
jgi:hypothetical protein